VYDRIIIDNEKCNIPRMSRGENKEIDFEFSFRVVNSALKTKM